MLDQERLGWNLTNHKPTFEAIEKIRQIRAEAIEFGNTIFESAPESRERSLALTNLEQTVMWTVASIARTETEDKQDE